MPVYAHDVETVYYAKVNTMTDKDIQLMAIEANLDKLQYLLRKKQYSRAEKTAKTTLGLIRSFMNYQAIRPQKTLRRYGAHPEWQKHHGGLPT